MPLSQSKMLIRVDAGIGIGAKRVNAMLALAREYRRRGGQTVMVVNEIPNSLLRRIETEGSSVHQIDCTSGSPDDRFETQEIIDLEKPDWLVICGNAFDSDFVKSVSKSAEFLILADGHERSTPADLVIGGDSSLAIAHGDTDAELFQPAPPEQQARPSQRLTGPAFALVDSAKVAQPASRKIVAQARRILVWNHGPDFDNWTLRTLQTLSDMASKRLIVDCVASSDYRHFAELENFKRHSKVTLRIHRNVDRIEPLAERTDLAVANGHAGCYRLAYLGVPSILVTTPESNLSVIEALHRHRAALSLASTTESGTNRSTDLVSALKKLLGDRFHRHSMSRHGMELVDGEGPKRVVNRMAGCMVSLRTATLDDCEIFWHWRNDPETRSVSLDASIIPWATHAEQFQQNLQSTEAKAWVVQNHAKDPIGKISVQLQDGGREAILDLSLDQRYRGRGTGSVLIETAAQKIFGEFGVERILAQVRAGNIATERSFRNTGFISIAPKIVNGVMANQFLRAATLERLPGETQKSKAA